MERAEPELGRGWKWPCVGVLVSAGIELTVFLVAGTVLCFEFSM